MSIIQLKRRSSQLLRKLYAFIFSVTHKVENKILFISFAGKQYSDNPRAISEKMHEMYPEHEIVWALNNDDTGGNIPDYVRIIHGTDKHGLRFIEERATSFCFVTNNENDSSVYKRKRQYFVQTYHGDRGFKKVLYDAGFTEKVTDSTVTDICMAGSEFAVNTFRKAFHYEGEVLTVGIPRNDILVFPNKANELSISKKLGIKEGTHILLYAPTFRDNNINRQAINVDLDEVLELLSRGNEEWVCLIRAHKSSNGFVKTTGDTRYLDVTNYPDMADLLQITDFLITDYSSCAGDLILRNKPIILAAFDEFEYENQCRSFSVDIDKTGFIVARNQNELNEYITKLTAKDYEQSCRKALAYYGTKETGCSAKTICDMIHKFYLSSVARNRPNS